MSASMMRSLPTRLDALPWHRLAPALAAAEDALARLDERIARSPIRDGWCERKYPSGDGRLVRYRRPDQFRRGLIRH